MVDEPYEILKEVELEDYVIEPLDKKDIWIEDLELRQKVEAEFAKRGKKNEKI